MHITIQIKISQLNYNAKRWVIQFVIQLFKIKFTNGLIFNFLHDNTEAKATITGIVAMESTDD